MAADPKPEEISHPPMDQLQGLEYCIDSNPSWGMFCFFCEYQVFLACFSLLFSNLVFVEAGESIALGFQHYILALGTAVMIPSFLVPLMGGNHVSRFLLSPSSDFYVSIALKIRTLGIWPERTYHLFLTSSRSIRPVKEDLYLSIYLFSFWANTVCFRVIKWGWCRLCFLLKGSTHFYKHCLGRVYRP